MKKFLDSIHVPTWLVMVLGFVLLLRIPSFFEPFSYGDEMIYLALGEGLRQGQILYSQVYDNKPPLLYILAAIAGNVFWFKAILAFWSLATVILFWKLSGVLFPEKPKVQKAATVIFALLTSLPLLEGNIANAENFMIGLSVAAFYILFSKTLNFKNIFASGVLFGLAALFKIPAAFELPVIIVYWTVTSRNLKSETKTIFRNSAYLLLGFISPLLVSFLWFGLFGAVKDYFLAAFAQNFGYLSSWRPDDASKSFFARNFPLLIRGALVLAASLILYLKRFKLSKQFIFLCLWVAFGLFAATLSERPYPHYLLQIAAPASFLFAILLAEKTFEQSLVIIPLAFVFLVPFYYKFWYYSTSAYYLRFLNFALGQTTKESYLGSFGRAVPRNYEIADYLINSTSKKEKVFVWGPDSSAVYALSRRLPPTKFVADYHINDFSDKVTEAGKLKNNPPKFIIILPGAKAFDELMPLLRSSYFLISEIDGAEIWRLRAGTN